MVVIPIDHRHAGDRPDVSGELGRLARHAGPAQRALRASSAHAACVSSRSTRTGEIQSRLSNDVGGVSTVVTDTASSVLSNVVVIISTLIAMSGFDPTHLAVALSAAGVPVADRQGRPGEARGRLQHPEDDGRHDLGDRGNVERQRHPVVEGIRASGYEISRFNKENERLTGLQIRQTMIGRSFFAVVGTFFSITPALVYLVAGVMLNRGNTLLSAGDLVAFTTLQSRLFFPIGSMLQVSTEVQSSLGVVRPDLRVPRLHHEITDAPDAEALVNTRGAVELDHVRFHYDASGGPRGGPSSTIASGRWTTCRCGSSPVSLPRSSGRAAPARRRSPISCRGCTTSTRARCASTARRAINHACVDRRCDRHRDAGDLSVPRHDPPQPALRASRCDAGGARGGGACRKHPQPDRRAGRGLRHRGR